MSSSIKRAASRQKDTGEAIKEIANQLTLENRSLVILFFSIDHAGQHLKESIEKHFADTLVIGCTTAGEIGPLGYANKSISAIGFSADHFKASYVHYPNLSQLEYNQWAEKSIKGHSEHHSRYKQADDLTTFGLLLIDGMTKHEEPLTRIISSSIPNMPIVGGSAGDELHYQNTYILLNGELHTDSGLLLFITTDLPFTPIKTQHLKASDKRMVVTEADPKSRTIKEINARPAAIEYANLLGLSSVEEITTEILAANPVVVLLGEEEYVRSIQQINADLSLTFYCAIDVGIVMRLAVGGDLVKSLETTFGEVENRVGPIQAMITFDCILRRIENENRQLADTVSALFQKYHCVGFNTYGEQFNGLHVNQTCTAIAIGYRNDDKE